MHINKDFSKDFRLAEKICKELIAKNKDAIIVIYENYHQQFIIFARKKIINPDGNHVNGVLNRFWAELLNPKVICSYEGRASLKSYLMTILKRRILDDNRAFYRQQSTKTNNEEDPKYILEKNDDLLSQEDELIQKEKSLLLKEAQEMLKKKYPKDADLIRMYLNGFDYGQMAKKKLKDLKEDQKNLIKLTNAIKKQFTRKRTGSKARFEECLNRCLKMHGLNYSDLLN